MRPLALGAAAGLLALLMTLPAVAVPDAAPSRNASGDDAWVRIADAAGAPLSHDALVPTMRQFAQGVPEGIRPGAWMDAPAACTMAFVVQDETGALYITTAGHCVNRIGQEVRVVGHGAIGHVVTFQNSGIGRDWALIRIDPAKYGEVDARMAAWGGPTGLFQGGSGLLVTKHYGFGALTWYTHETRCRVALAQANQFSSTHFEMSAVIIWGDSGSPTVLDDGTALGINTHLKYDSDNAAGTRLDHALNLAGQRTGHTYTLVQGGSVEPVCADT